MEAPSRWLMTAWSARSAEYVPSDCNSPKADDRPTTGCQNPTFPAECALAPAVNLVFQNGYKRSRDFVGIQAGYEVGQTFALNEDVPSQLPFRLCGIPGENRLNDALVFVKRVRDAMARA